MVEKANSTKQMAKPSKSTPAAAQPTPSKTTSKLSAEVVSDSDESGSDSEVEEQQPRDVTYRYQPPQNFTALSAADSLRDSNPFSAANLKGKQLWFITAPANAPISRLPAFSPVDVAEGNPVMEIKGRSFCLNEDTEALDGSVKIMFPDSKGVYRAVGQSIEKAFRMVESLPKRRKISKDQIPEAQPVRLQPEGLRMRYKPFGAVGDAEDEVMGGCQ